MTKIYTALATLGMLLVVACSSSPTFTPIPTATNTPTPTVTAVPTPTDIPTPVPTPTATPTVTPTRLPTATFTPRPSTTPTATATPTLVPTPTATATATPEPTPTPTATPTATPTPTSIPTPTPTAVPLNPGQFPPFPTILSGAVTVGGAPAPDGTAIYAQVGYWRSDTVTTSGGRYVGIVVRPVDWSLHLKSITFHSGGVQAQETAVFNGGILQTETLGLTFPAPLPQ